MARFDSTPKGPASGDDADPAAEPVPLVRTSTRTGGVGPPLQHSIISAGSRTYRIWNERRQTSVLEELFATLNNEIETRLRLEQEVDMMRATLKQAADALLRTQALEMQARHLANHDELTALTSRSHFSHALHAALGESGGSRAPLSVVYLDLDDFKAVNDEHGHQTGDDLLKIVASRLSHVVRSEDVLSRLGGDEFACLLTGSLTREQLQGFAMKLYDALSPPCQIGQLSIQIRPSIGIASCPGDAISARALLKKADAAMYAAKRAGTCFAFCTQAPDAGHSV